VASEDLSIASVYGDALHDGRQYRIDLKTQRLTAEAIESQDRMLRDLRRFRDDVDGARTNLD
jgi:hypothetical protein